jgi:hypothetical protein
MWKAPTAGEHYEIHRGREHVECQSSVHNTEAWRSDIGKQGSTESCAAPDHDLALVYIREFRRLRLDRAEQGEFSCFGGSAR